MSAGDPDDILRSLRRYTSLLLQSPPWTVRVQRVRVDDDERPVAIVQESGPMTVPHSRAGTLQQGDVQYQQALAIACYPVIGESAAASAEAARQVRTLLVAGFTRGLRTDDDPPVNIGGPWRVPIYDFDGVPIQGAGREGPVDPYAHMNVDDSFNVRPVQDAVDELRYTVMANLRVSWWAAGRIPGDSYPLAVSMTGTYVKGPDPEL